MAKLISGVLFALFSILLYAQPSAIIYPCKYFVNGERLSFYQDNLHTVEHYIGKAKCCYVINIADTTANINVYQIARDSFIINVNNHTFSYRASLPEEEKTEEISAIPPNAKALEKWGKRTGYCTALTRSKEPVLIIYEK